MAGSYNVGPENNGCVSTARLASLFCHAWGDGAAWEHVGDHGPHEDAVLKLDCSKIQEVLGWHPRWTAERAVRETVDWTKAWLAGEEMSSWTRQQIEMFYTE